MGNLQIPDAPISELRGKINTNKSSVRSVILAAFQFREIGTGSLSLISAFALKEKKQVATLPSASFKNRSTILFCCSGRAP